MPKNGNSSDKPVSKQRKCMAIILQLLPNIQKKEFERRMRQLYATDSVEGPEAVAWGLKILASKCEGKHRRFFLEQMDNARNDAAIMRRIRKDWLQYGVTDPWWVIHHSENK